MAEREAYLRFWGYPLTGEVADAAWAAKVKLDTDPPRAPMAFVQRDVCYDSPIDGKPITNKHARAEDLKRSGCIEYDPGMRQDAVRKAQERDKALDAAAERTVEEVVSSMPSRKRESLYSELASGASAEIVRKAP